jgi:hypothetical protein
MNDPFSKKVEDIERAAKAAGLQIFYGWLGEESSVPSAHWNGTSGGSWDNFLACAKIAGANILYLNSAPFEQTQVDDAIEQIEREVAESEDKEDVSSETNELITQIREFEAKVELICVIDLAFVAGGVIHIYHEGAEWFDDFVRLLPGEDEDDADDEEVRPDKTVVDKWANDLAGHPNYVTAKDRRYLLEKIAGEGFQRLPVYEILNRADTVFEAQFRPAAEQKLSEEIGTLREQGLNLEQIAVRLGISRNRVSGLAPAAPTKKR